MSATSPPLQAGRIRHHSATEKFADGCVHVAGLIAAVAGGTVLILLARHDGGKLAAVLIYAGAMLAMLSASAAYNIAYYTRYRNLLQRLDHSAIFLMIAGTYTPFTTIWYTGWPAIAITSGIWALALGGIALRNFAPVHFRRWRVALYLGLGWIAVFVLGPMMLAAPPLTWAMFVMGGLLYTVGVIFYVWKNLAYQNAIWHGFVTLAAGCHYISVLNGVVLAA